MKKRRRKGKKVSLFQTKKGLFRQVTKKKILEITRNMVTLGCWEKEKNFFSLCSIFWWR